MKFILLFLLLASLNSFSQSISVATGYSSRGFTAAMLTAETAKHVLYFKSIQDCVIADDSPVGYVENHEYVFGYGYRVHEDVTLLAGIGSGQDRIVVEYTYGNGFKQGKKEFCYEIGFRYDLFHMERIDLSLIWLMNYYSTMSTMVGISYKFRK